MASSNASTSSNSRICVWLGSSQGVVWQPESETQNKTSLSTKVGLQGSMKRRHPLRVTGGFVGERGLQEKVMFQSLSPRKGKAAFSQEHFSSASSENNNSDNSTHTCMCTRTPYIFITMTKNSQVEVSPQLPNKQLTKDTVCKLPLGLIRGSRHFS